MQVDRRRGRRSLPSSLAGCATFAHLHSPAACWLRGLNITTRTWAGKLRERNKRDSHILTATMRSSRIVEQSILVRNISSRGLGARTSGVLPVEGEEVHLELNGQSLVGHVRWVRGDRFGIHLRDPLDAQTQSVANRWWRKGQTTPSFQVAQRFKPVNKAWRPSVVGYK